MPPRRGRPPSLYVCTSESTFYKKYSKTIFISCILVLTGVAFLYCTLNQDYIIKHHILMIEKRLSEILVSLPVFRRIANSVQNNVGKCTTNKDEQIKAVVWEALDHYYADKTGKPDYALESAGGTVISTRATECYHRKTLSLFGIPLCTINCPNVLIQPGVMPGQCWSFKGHTGSAVIRLITKIYVTGVSVEHIPRNISHTGDISSAPKQFSIWALKSPEDKEHFFFGEFTYDITGQTVQYFPVKHKSLRMFDIIEFEVHSNHGHPVHTCVYRLRVHGDLDTD